MNKIVFTAVTGGKPETDAQRQMRIDAAVARCVSPIGTEEAILWDEHAARLAKAA